MATSEVVALEQGKAFWDFEGPKSFLGGSTFGYVFVASSPENKRRKVAVKVVPLRPIGGDERPEDNKEIQIGCRLAKSNCTTIKIQKSM